MNKVPISLIVDDPAPLVSVYYAHAGTRYTEDGRLLLEFFPNETLNAFCDVVEHRGIKGKFSVVPMPANRGNIFTGLEGVDQSLVEQWLHTVKTRLLPAFTVGPEMLTHHHAVDLATGNALDCNEQAWAATQDRTGLTPYIARAVEILRDGGFDVCGVTSPWAFGIEVEPEYAAAISQAVWQVTGKKNAWYFLRSRRDVPNAKPWVELEAEGRCLVSIPATTPEVFWASINTADTSEEFICERADLLITEDGKGGAIPQVLETGGYPILICHWQSLISNGLLTGMRILDKVAERVNRHLADRVQWCSFEEILNMVVAEKENYPKPVFA